MMTEQIKSKYNVGNHVAWRSFCDLEEGTGKIYKIKLSQDRNCLYYFEYLVEDDNTEERMWINEYDIAYQMQKKGE